MTLEYRTIQAWLKAKKGLIANSYDDVNLITGREGRGKSTWALKIARALDPTFTVARVHYDFEDYLQQVGSLSPGQAILLDEARLHKRESMAKDRMAILDHFKENRALGIHHFIVFNRISSVDKDLVTDRISHWSYIRNRGFVEVRQPHTELVFDKFGQFHESTTYPLVGKFDFTPKLPEGMAQAYWEKKVARMKDRAATLREPVPESKPKPLVNPAILAQVIAELKR